MSKHLRVSKDGIKYYTYYKKKRGRKRKPGPRKKPKKRGRSWQQKWDFKIVRCDNKKQERVIGIFHNIYEADKARQELEKQNNSIKFPVNYTTGPRDNNRVRGFMSEYLILERINDSNKDEKTYLRNEYGKLVEQTTNSTKWKIYDKFPILKEETFWVFGMNPHNDRKDFQWIVDNLFDFYINSGDFATIRVSVYYNKLILKYDIDEFNMVICKNISDSIRLYNKLSEIYQKQKNIVFCGRVLNKSEIGQNTIKLIQDYTGWDKDKIIRTTTY